jgi:hypothetical protein
VNRDVLDETVQLLAACGDLDRIEDLHRLRRDGRCAACGPIVTWPCLHVTVAHRARRLREALQS